MSITKNGRKAVTARPSTMNRIDEISREYRLTKSALAEIAFKCFFQQIDSVLNRDEFMADCRSFAHVNSDGRLDRGYG